MVSDIYIKSDFLFYESHGGTAKLFLADMYSQPRWVLGHGHKINVRSGSDTDLTDIKEGFIFLWVKTVSLNKKKLFSKPNFNL